MANDGSGGLEVLTGAARWLDDDDDPDHELYHAARADADAELSELWLRGAYVDYISTLFGSRPSHQHDAFASVDDYSLDATLFFLQTLEVVYESGTSVADSLQGVLCYLTEPSSTVAAATSEADDEPPIVEQWEKRVEGGAGPAPAVHKSGSSTPDLASGLGKILPGDSFSGPDLGYEEAWMRRVNDGAPSERPAVARSASMATGLKTMASEPSVVGEDGGLMTMVSEPSVVGEDGDRAATVLQARVRGTQTRAAPPVATSEVVYRPQAGSSEAAAVIQARVRGAQARG